MRYIPTSRLISATITCVLLTAPTVAGAMDAERGTTRAMSFAQKKKVAPATKKKAAATAPATAAPGKKNARVVASADSLFQAIAGKDSLISKDELATYLDSRPAAARSGSQSQLADQLFQYLDINRDAMLNQREFAEYAVLVGGAPRASPAAHTPGVAPRLASTPRAGAGLAAVRLAGP